MEVVVVAARSGTADEGRGATRAVDLLQVEAVRSRAVDASEVMAAYAAAWEDGDTERAWSWYADDVVMHLPGRGSLAGDHRGRTAVIEAIQKLLARTGDLSVEVEVLDRLASGDRVAMVLHESV